MKYKILFIALAGCLGTLSRYWLAGAVQKLFEASFPWGTLAVNLAGCFLAGFFWSLLEYRVQISGEARSILFIGFMGAFTTFSAFMLETSELARNSEWLKMAANVFLQNGLGFAALFSGIVTGRLL